MCLVIDDPVETLRVEWVTARKSHTCEECRRSIEPGERYFLHVAVSDYTGGIDQWKMCAHCSALIDVGCELTGCPRTWYWGEVLDLFPDDLGFVGDILSHHLPPGGRFRFLRLVVAAQRRWRSRSGELLPIPALLTEGETDG